MITREVNVSIDDCAVALAKGNDKNQADFFYWFVSEFNFVCKENSDIQVYCIAKSICEWTQKSKIDETVHFLENLLEHIKEERER